MIKNNILKYILLISLVSCFFPLVVFGESQTYTEIKAGECLGFSADTQIKYKFYTDVRAVYLNQGLWVFTGSNDYIRGSSSRNYACPASAGSGIVSANTYNGHGFLTISTGYSSEWQPFIPYVNAPSNAENAWYYTYGDGAVGPIEPVNWGILQSPGYSTKIAGSGEASAANIDTVIWSLPYDSNNNDITENGVVDVRAVRGKWAGETAEALQGKDYSTFSLEQSGANLGTVPASQGNFTASWSNVMDALDMSSLFLLLIHQVTGETWEKDGWIYQIRLRVPDDEYTGDWQTVYTATSTSVTGSDTIINNNSYNIEVNQALTEITQVNNNTSVTYTYYDTNITIENPDAGTEPEGGTNLWDVLKELISGIFQLLAKLGDIANSIANIIGDLIDELLNMIQSLFMPQDIDITVNQQFEEHTQTIKESTGLFGQALDFETNLHDMFADIEPSEPLLSWPALTVDDVTYIPSGSINLLDYVEDSEASDVYSTFQNLISGVIYFSLLLTILRKLKGVLNK